MSVIYTNMDWKAAPGYDPSKSTAGLPDPETGIVKCKEGTTARTDELEICFCGDLPEEQAEKIRSYAADLKSGGSKRGVELKAPIPETASKVAAQAAQRTAYIGSEAIVKVNVHKKTAVTAADGSSFTVRYAYDKESGIDYRDNYLSHIKEIAETGVRSAASACCKCNIRADIMSCFSTASSFKEDEAAINNAYQSALKEIGQNIADGKENPLSGLKTTLTVNGTKWNFADLLNTVEEMNKSFEYYGTKGNLDYSDYAQLGVSKARVTAWAGKNLSEDKRSVVEDSLNARVETYIRRERDAREEYRHIWDKPGVYMTGEKAKYYETAFLSASNKEVREEIMKLFEETDYESPASVANTVGRYKKIMLPIFEAFCGSKSAAPDYVNSAVNGIYKYIAGLFGSQGAQGLNVSV